MDYTMLEEARELAGWNAEEEVLSIYQVMHQLKDKRRKQGKRYPLALLLTYILLAKAAGETTLQAIAEWIRLRGCWLAEVLPGVRTTFPCAATYSNVLRAVEAEQVNEILMALLIRARSASRGRPLRWPWMARPCEERKTTWQKTKRRCTRSICTK